MIFDPTKIKDREIAYEAKKKHENYISTWRRARINKRRAYTLWTLITPIPFGEGKTTTLIGLVQRLGKRRKKVIGTLRQPSSSPTSTLKEGQQKGTFSNCPLR